MARNTSVTQYLLDQLWSRGIRHIFGVPGDYVLGVYERIGRSPIQHVGTTREDSAGFAADAYARVRGLGAVCVTYCVGGFNVVNPVAGAYAEKSPVLVISGAPGMKEREHNPLLHHRVRDFSTQRQIFEHITVASAALEDPTTAFHEVDRVLAAIERYKRPGFIEIPRDRVDIRHTHRHTPSSVEDWTDDAALQECIAEATHMVNQSRRPVILAGVEVHRFGLQDSLLDLIRKTNFPVASTLLGKSVISEEHPLCLGVYEGAMGRAEVQNVVESADCVIMLGCFMTDLNLGIYTANLDPSHTIYATSEKVSVRRHRYDDIPFRAFFKALLDAPLRRRRKPTMPDTQSIWGPQALDGDKVTIRSLFQELNRFITDDMVIISDTGDSLFGAADLKIHRRTEFIGPAYYTSMGFAVPGALGAQLADPSLRPIVLVGDGAFQMTGLELSTIARLGLNPIVLVLNNRGYSTERQIMDGPFNDITFWDFHRVPDLLGTGKGFVVHTVRDFRQALRASLDNRESYSIIDIHLDPYDISPALQRLGAKLGKRIRGKIE